MRPEDMVVFGALAGAAALVLLRSASLGMLGRLGNSMGPAEWDFSKSWASTFTVVGAGLSTILSAKGVVPDKTQILPNAAYAALSLSFGLMVVLAPFVYVSMSKPVGSAAAPAGSPQYQGSVVSFLLATLFTVWGVGGQMVTILLLLYEIHLGSGISSGVVIALLVVFAGVALLFVRYIWVYFDAVESSHQAAFKAMARTPSANVNVPLPRWPLL